MFIRYLLFIPLCTPKHHVTFLNGASVLLRSYQKAPASHILASQVSWTLESFPSPFLPFCSGHFCAQPLPLWDSSHTSRDDKELHQSYQQCWQLPGTQRLVMMDRTCQPLNVCHFLSVMGGTQWYENADKEEIKDDWHYSSNLILKGFLSIHSRLEKEREVGDHRRDVYDDLQWIPKFIVLK